MKNLKQIKNDYAKSKSFEDFEDILLGDINILRHSVDELLILVQKECLKNASDNVTTIHHILEPQEDVVHSVKLTKQSITNENNIIK